MVLVLKVNDFSEDTDEQSVHMPLRVRPRVLAIQGYVSVVVSFAVKTVVY